MYIFPGLGLGACTIGTRQVSDNMVLTSAETLASLVTPEEMAHGLVYPSLDRVRDISARIAAAVAQCAIDEVGRRQHVHVHVVERASNYSFSSSGACGDADGR